MKSRRRVCALASSFCSNRDGHLQRVAGVVVCRSLSLLWFSQAELARHMTYGKVTIERKRAFEPVLCHPGDAVDQPGAFGVLSAARRGIPQ